MILIVDDNVPSAETLALLIGFSGYTTQVAHDGVEALRVAEAHKPDVVLLDLNLPGMDGFEIARQLRQKETSRDAMLVAVTGYGQEDDRRRTSEAGFKHHLVKPIDLGLLEQILSGFQPI